MAGQVPNPGGWSPTSSPSPPDYWSVCLDGSDTAVHISYRRELFKSLVPNRRRLSSPTDEELFSESSGTMSIDCPSEGGWQTLELPNALYVPRSNDTCLSISMLFKQHANSRLQLTPEGCSVELNVGNGVIRLQAEPKGCFSFSLSKFPGFLSGMSTPSERSLSPWTSPSRVVVIYL
ncbi:uncharacterized protein N7483_000580 [Penicillium malachiteum]|uniref:uncharacterized protein n=1 Tax=Penicillium malachiteum TaxID=1324776 RepID=UPI0025465B62|nr:uncharacterized protein N7483_000580 [Penicillium malachiteum]KAJ5735455.1 hypothetical protein N7483_000580 [Penicillium malachiteum]